MKKIILTLIKYIFSEYFILIYTNGINGKTEKLEIISSNLDTKKIIKEINKKL